MREVHLRLMARRRLEANHRLGDWRRPDLTDVRFQLRVAADISGGLDLVEQTRRRQRGIRVQIQFRH